MKGSSLKKGLTEQSKIKQKEPRGVTKKGQRPKKRSKSASGGHKIC